MIVNITESFEGSPIVWLVPTLWMVSLSFQPNEVLARTTSTTAFGLIPIPFTSDNYAALFSFGQTPMWFFNSLVVAAGMTLGVLAVSTTAGYALARLEFPFKRAILVICLVGLVLPEQAVFIPLYTMFADFGWHNSYHALILPRMAVPIGVFLMMQFFKAIPQDIEEAARIDGVGWLQIFWHVMLPLARPAMMTLAINQSARNDKGGPEVPPSPTEFFQPWKSVLENHVEIHPAFAQSGLPCKNLRGRMGRDDDLFRVKPCSNQRTHQRHGPKACRRRGFARTRLVRILSDHTQPRVGAGRGLRDQLNNRWQTIGWGSD